MGLKRYNTKTQKYPRPYRNLPSSLNKQQDVTVGSGETFSEHSLQEPVQPGGKRGCQAGGNWVEKGRPRLTGPQGESKVKLTAMTAPILFAAFQVLAHLYPYNCDCTNTGQIAK